MLAFVIDDPAIANPPDKAARVGINLAIVDECGGLTAPKKERPIVRRIGRGSPRPVEKLNHDRVRF
nr:hypothetical protein [Methylobacterium soli]